MKMKNKSFWIKLIGVSSIISGIALWLIAYGVTSANRNNDVVLVKYLVPDGYEGSLFVIFEQSPGNSRVLSTYEFEMQFDTSGLHLSQFQQWPMAIREGFFFVGPSGETTAVPIFDYCTSEDPKVIQMDSIGACHVGTFSGIAESTGPYMSGLAIGKLSRMPQILRDQIRRSTEIQNGFSNVVRK